MKHTYKVNGMHCSACVEKIKKALKEVNGIKEVDLDLQDSMMILSMDHHVETDLVNQELKKAGNYSVSENHPVKPLMETDISEDDWKVYLPVFLIFFYITTVSALIEISDSRFLMDRFMRNFMGGFFLVFSFFKMLDLNAFASAYSSYDVIAKRIFSYGYIYPFLELGLGLAYVLNFFPFFTNAFAFVLMGVSSIGVIQSLLSKRKFQCACLGAVFKLPMSKITLIEDLLMFLMSGWMLINLI